MRGYAVLVLGAIAFISSSSVAQLPDKAVIRLAASARPLQRCAMADQSFKYDVAFSFLSRDLETAHQLGDLLPGLSVFIFDRRKEELLGGDGMDVFGQTFGHDTRLTVILHRAGWGATPWTGYEESHIKGRAMNHRMASFLVVRLDQDSELPLWVPDYHIWIPLKDEGLVGAASSIRLRAKERGAIVRRLSVAEQALEQSRRAREKAEREVRERSAKALPEIHAAAAELFAEIQRIVYEIKAGDPDYRIQVGSAGNQCGIAGGGVSTTLVIHQAYGAGTPHDMVLSVTDWQGNRAIPGAHLAYGGGTDPRERHYAPGLRDDGVWGWRSLDERPQSSRRVIFIGFRDDEVLSSAELAEKVVGRHIERLNEPRR